MPIYHYGSYEPRAIAKLSRRYDTDSESLKSRLVNVNTFVYARVYFPVRSNRLKEVGGFIGMTWTSPDASGLQSLVWRHHWNETRDAHYHDLLVTYNEEDCLALKLLTDELSRIQRSADVLSEVDFVSQPKRRATEEGKQVHSQFESMLRSAHSNYRTKRISFRQDEDERSVEGREEKKPSPKRGYEGHRQARPQATQVIQVAQREFCPKCENVLLRPTELMSSRLIIDVASTENGLSRDSALFLWTDGDVTTASSSIALSEYDILYLVRSFGPHWPDLVRYQSRTLPQRLVCGIMEPHLDSGEIAWNGIPPVRSTEPWPRSNCSNASTTARTLRTLCRQLGLSLKPGSLPFLRRRYRQGGSTWEALLDHRHGHSYKMTPERRAWLKTQKQENPALTQAELVQRFEEEFQVSISQSHVSNVLRAEGVAIPGGQRYHPPGDPVLACGTRRGLFSLRQRRCRWRC